MLLRTLALAAASAVFVVLGVQNAVASQLIDRNSTGVQLAANSKGQALLIYRSHGVLHHVLASGAIGAQPPNRATPQVHFVINYRGPSALPGAACGAYDGPQLAWLVKACKAPDGSYWALQSWQRLQPNYGGTKAPWELRLSHWVGDPAEMQIGLDWAYRRFDHLFGRLTYAGQPVYGFLASRSGNPLDTYGRNVYLDTLDSSYGQGWHRENSFLLQNPTGAFCYGFFAHGGKETGKGMKYRATIIGPGVTPDVMWEGDAPGAFDQTRDLQATEEQKQLFASSAAGGCTPK
jgi:hypothetical protein